MRQKISKSRHADTAHSVGEPFVSLLLGYLRASAIDPETLLDVTPADDLRIPADSWQAMLQKSAAALATPALGLSLAAQVTWRHFGVVGYLAWSCSTVGEALQRGLRFADLITEAHATQMRIDDRLVHLSWPARQGANWQLADEVGVGIIVALMRPVAGIEFSATRVDFVAPAPVDTAPYEDFFGCKVYFDQPELGLSFSRRYLDLPLPNPDPELLALLDAQAEEKLQKLMPLRGELQELRQQLLQLLREGKTHIDDLAAYNHQSTRMLQRRFSALGSSFQALLDETRRYLAEQYLADGNIELHEVAALLGYSEQSSFTRAFRHWSGATPGQWRRLKCRS